MPGPERSPPDGRSPGMQALPADYKPLQRKLLEIGNLPQPVDEGVSKKLSISKGQLDLPFLRKAD